MIKASLEGMTDGRETIRTETSLGGMSGGGRSLPRRSGDATFGTRMSGVQTKGATGGTGARRLTGGATQRLGIKRERTGNAFRQPARGSEEPLNGVGILRIIPGRGGGPEWRGRKTTGVTAAVDTTGPTVRGRTAGGGSSGGARRGAAGRAMQAAGGSLLPCLGGGGGTRGARPRDGGAGRLRG